MAVHDVECCDFYQVHEKVVEAVHERIPDEDILYDLAELFKVFGDSTRIKILYVLTEAEMCVCDIAQVLNMTQSAISHQLKILNQEVIEMKKKFKLEDLDCANCAAKMEDGIKKIDGVTSASVSFMTQKLVIEADDARFDEIMKEVVAVCAKVEPDCKILM